MSANILLIEYERGTVDEIRSALSGRGHRLEVVGDLDTAVQTCAHFEPKVVIITASLPGVSVGDAITQLRARAGLRVTPFLVLVGSAGDSDGLADAEALGLHDTLARDRISPEIASSVDALLSRSSEILTTQAVPQETIDALRKGGSDDQEASFSSNDLFADILSDVEKDGSRKPAPSSPSAAESDAGVDVDGALSEVLVADAEKPQPKPKSSKTDVDALLSETLAGLEIPGAKKIGREQPEASAPSSGKDKQAESTPEPEPAAPPQARPQPATPKGPSEPAVEQRPPAEPPAEKKAEKKPVSEQPAPAPADADPGTPVPAGTTFGQYVIEEHVATGGMAQVYKARMLGLEGFQKTVAIKRILPHLSSNEDFVTMFVDEAKLAAQLNHPNIIHIYDLGKIDGSHFIAMEYIEGRDLRSILDDCRRRDVRVPVPLALYIATLLASALDYAHKKRDFDNRDLGLVHRDVSPQNVLISSAGEIKLCDFGIAKAASKASHTHAGALKGKLQYMSPEQAWGKDIDHRSDIFSLGLVLYEMLTANKVFAGDSELSILEQARNPDVAAPSEVVPGIPADVDRITLKALAPERGDRYQTALDFLRDCEAVLKSNGWEPDTAALVAFIDELASGAAISGLAAGAGAPPPPGTPPPAVAADQPEPEPEPTPTVEPEPASEDAPGAEPAPVAAAVVAESAPVATDDGDGDKRAGLGLWLAIVAVAIVAVAAGWWFLAGSGGGTGGGDTGDAPGPIAAAVADTPTPAPVVEDGLMNEAELLERAREVASAEMAKQEQELRERLEQEFPTPTPLPPTPTPTDTPTETPTPEPTATPVPPTPTRVPPTATPIPPTPTEVVNEGDIVEPGAGVVPPVLLHQVPPEYPPLAQRAGISGVAVAQLLVGIDGRIEDVRIITVPQTGVGFESAVETAVRKWRYRPATKNGVKVRVWVTIRIKLSLN